MNVNATTAAYTSYDAAKTENVTKKDSKAKADIVTKDGEVKKDTTSANGTTEAAVYEKTTTEDKKAPYSINKMSAEERNALVDKLKADQEARQQQLVSLVQKMISGQAGSFGIANDDEDSIWRFLASGKFTVDAATKAQAQQDISEDGYYGVKQTSERLFDFASALAGDDVEQMKKMQAAIEKGYKAATKSWGKELPGICKETLDATNKLFDDYYASKETSAETTKTESTATAE